MILLKAEETFDNTIDIGNGYLLCWCYKSYHKPYHTFFIKLSILYSVSLFQSVVSNAIPYDSNSEKFKVLGAQVLPSIFVNK